MEGPVQHSFGDLGRRFVRPAWRIGLILGALWGAAVIPLPASATAHTFTTIDVPGSIYTDVSGIDNSGQIVGTSYTGSIP